MIFWGLTLVPVVTAMPVRGAFCGVCMHEMWQSLAEANHFVVLMNWRYEC